jgi:hypothetical protein
VRCIKLRLARIVTSGVFFLTPWPDGLALGAAQANERIGEKMLSAPKSVECVGHCVASFIRTAHLSTVPNRDSSGSLFNDGFSACLTGWTAIQPGGHSSRETVIPISGAAQLTEGDSVLVTLGQSFVVPAGGLQLSFDLMFMPGFDQSDFFLWCPTSRPNQVAFGPYLGSAGYFVFQHGVEYRA